MLEKTKKDLVILTFFLSFLVISFLVGAFTAKNQMQDMTEFYHDELEICENQSIYSDPSNSLNQKYNSETIVNINTSFS